MNINSEKESSEIISGKSSTRKVNHTPIPEKNQNTKNMSTTPAERIFTTNGTNVAKNGLQTIPMQEPFANIDHMQTNSFNISNNKVRLINIHASITRTLINKFQQHIKSNETASNQTMILSAVSSFLKHLAEEDVTDKDRSSSLKIPAAPKPKKKKDLTIDQVKQIMLAADNMKAKALLAAAYFAGLRTKETVYLSTHDCKVVDER